MDTALKYTGLVTISYDKTEHCVQTHNNGKFSLFRLFAKLLYNKDIIKNSEIPKYIDLYAINMHDSTVSSCLINKLVVSKSYLEDSGNAYAVMQATLNFTNIGSAVKTANKFYFTLESESNEILAESVQIDPINIVSIVPGTQAIITWKLYISN